MDDRAEHVGDLVAGRLDPGFMREFEPNAFVLDPAHDRFEPTATADLDLDPVPQAKRRDAFDHRTAARQVDQLDWRFFAFVDQADLLVTEPIAIDVAVVDLAAFRTWNGKGREALPIGRMAWRVLELLGPEQRP